MLALLVATEESGVESPFWGESEVREEHLLSTEIPGGGFPDGGIYLNGGEKNRVVVSWVRGTKKQNVEAS